MPPDQPHPDALPIRLAIATEEDVVYRGLASVATDIDNLELLGRSLELAVDPGIDVALYDVAALSHSEGTDLDWLVKETDAAVVATARDLRPDLAARALDRGVDGVVSLSAGARELRTVIVAAATGNLRGEGSVDDIDYTGGSAKLGKAEGLSAREVQVLGMIAMGLSNEQIAQELFLSINSVKTYIRSAYRKMGVTTRSQAIAWAVQHGFALEERRAPATDSPGPRWVPH